MSTKKVWMKLMIVAAVVAVVVADGSQKESFKPPIKSSISGTPVVKRSADNNVKLSSGMLNYQTVSIPTEEQKVVYEVPTYSAQVYPTIAKTYSAMPETYHSYYAIQPAQVQSSYHSVGAEPMYYYYPQQQLQYYPVNSVPQYVKYVR